MTNENEELRIKVAAIENKVNRISDDINAFFISFNSKTSIERLVRKILEDFNITFTLSKKGENND